jgi:hypothetical protein
MFQLEAHDLGILSARRLIRRDAAGNGRLGPLVIENRTTDVQGRLVGLLPPRGARQ